MRLTDETGIPETRYFPVIAIDDSGRQKVALFPSMSADQFIRSGKPYLEEVMPHIYHLHGKTKSAEIACPCCGKQDGTLLQFTHKCGHVSVPSLSVRRTRK